MKIYCMIKLKRWEILKEMNKKIFFTGASGFVGKFLTKYLEKKNFEVTKIQAIDCIKPGCGLIWHVD